MKKMDWLRYGLTSFMVTGFATGATLAGCSDDATVTPAKDGGTADTGPVADTGVTTPDTGAADTGPKDSGPTPKPATLYAVNAAVDIGNSVDRFTGGAIRFCYVIKGLGVSSGPARPDTAVGVPIGTGGPFPPPTSLQTFELTPVIILAENLAQRGIFADSGAPQPDCTKLLPVDPGGPDGGVSAPDSGLTLNKDFYVLDTIPSGTLKDDRSYMLLLTGCSGDSTQSSNCGSGFVTNPGTKGTLKVSVLELDRNAPATATGAGFQVVHGSSALAALSYPVKPVILNGGTQSALTPGGQVNFQNISPRVDVPSFNGGSPQDGGALFGNINPDGGPVTDLQPLNGPQSISQVTGIPDPSVGFAAGRSHTIVILGDPSKPFAPGFDAGVPLNGFRGVHRLGFPNK